MPAELTARHPPSPAALDALAEFVACSRALAVLTGAGCSTESGIPDYRDVDGEWKHRPPIDYRDFIASATARRRYWARSLIGWQRIATARPNAAHRALARLEQAGRLQGLITQNVDGLHQRAGSRQVIDLHGRLDAVDCLGCRGSSPREVFQQRLEALNPGWREHAAVAVAPDGDADPGEVDYAGFRVPDCERCGSMMKPAVVFFGESVPRARLAAALAVIERADALLVVGSSLMVFSGLRFVHEAAGRGMPIAAVNLGRTRADPAIRLKIAERCGAVLPALAARLGLPDSPSVH